MELVNRAYETWNRDDVEAALEMMHGDVEWHSSGVFPGFKPVYHGHTGVREWWATLKEPWDYFVIHIREIDARGETVVASIEFEAVGKESGAQVLLPFVNVFHFRDGLLAKLTSHRSKEEALAAIDANE